jgi:hypothetical protein
VRGAQAGGVDSEVKLYVGKTHTQPLIEDPMSGGRDVLTDEILTVVRADLTPGLLSILHCLIVWPIVRQQSPACCRQTEARRTTSTLCAKFRSISGRSLRADHALRGRPECRQLVCRPSHCRIGQHTLHAGTAMLVIGPRVRRLGDVLSDCATLTLDIRLA